MPCARLHLPQRQLHLQLPQRQPRTLSLQGPNEPAEERIGWPVLPGFKCELPCRQFQDRAQTSRPQQSDHRV